jgi:hypothetical protein
VIEQAFGLDGLLGWASRLAGAVEIPFFSPSKHFSFYFNILYF